MLPRSWGKLPLHLLWNTPPWSFRVIFCSRWILSQLNFLPSWSVQMMWIFCPSPWYIATKRSLKSQGANLRLQEQTFWWFRQGIPLTSSQISNQLWTWTFRSLRYHSTLNRSFRHKKRCNSIQFEEFLSWAPKFKFFRSMMIWLPWNSIIFCSRLRCAHMRSCIRSCFQRDSCMSSLIWNLEEWNHHWLQFGCSLDLLYLSLASFEFHSSCLGQWHRIGPGPCWKS